MTGAAQPVQQEYEVLGRHRTGARIIEGFLALGKRSTADDPTRRIEQAMGTSVPSALQAPAVTPARIGPELRARRFDHPPRSSLSKSWILSSLG